MKKEKKLVQKWLVIGCISMLLAGCGGLERQIQEYAEEKEYCKLNTEDVTKFTYKGNEYTVLEETVENTDLGEWVGYIRRYVVADENGGILLQENVEEASLGTLTKLAVNDWETMYFITFLNVYEDLEDGEYVIVDVNGEYHKAMTNVSVTDTKIIYDFHTEQQNERKEFVLNPENATQLLCDEAVYQVTSKTIEEQQLGRSLDLLAQRVTYDTETNVPLSNEELRKINWFGTSLQKRENRLYLDVREIAGTDSAEAVAVKVDREYLIAERQ